MVYNTLTIPSGHITAFMISYPTEQLWGATMEKTSMHIAAGILDIVSAVFKLFTVFGLIIAIIIAENNAYIDWAMATGGFHVDVVAILLTITIPLAILGVLAIVGGIYALRGQKWSLALAGSIGAALPFSILGIAAFIVTVLTKEEFE